MSCSSSSSCDSSSSSFCSDSSSSSCGSFNGCGKKKYCGTAEGKALAPAGVVAGCYRPRRSCDKGYDGCGPSKRKSKYHKGRESRKSVRKHECSSSESRSKSCSGSDHRRKYKNKQDKHHKSVRRQEHRNENACEDGIDFKIATCDRERGKRVQKKERKYKRDDCGKEKSKRRRESSDCSYSKGKSDKRSKKHKKVEACGKTSKYGNFCAPRRRRC